MPPSLLVNDRDELVHVFGGASRFLRARDGRQALDVVEQVTDQLKVMLAAGLRRVRMSSEALVFKNIRLVEGEGETTLSVTLRRIKPRNSELSHVLVSFHVLEAG